MATSSIIRSLAKTVAATAFGGPLAGAGTAVNEAIDLFAERLSGRDKDVYAASLKRLEGSLVAFARAEKLPRELVEQGLESARLLIARSGATVTEMAALDLDAERVSAAVLARGEPELRLLDEGADELCRRAVHSVYAALLADDAALPGLEGAFRRAVLTTLHTLPDDIAEAARLAVEAIAANQSAPTTLGPSRLATLAGRLESEFALRSDPGGPATPAAADAHHIARFVKDPAREQGEPIALEDAVGAGTRLLLSGGSGSGKTASLLHLAVDRARAAVGSATTPIPLYGRLASFDTLSEGFDRVVSLIANACGLTPSEIDALWRQEERPVLFLLDGLNEVNREYRASCLATLAGEFIAGPHGYVVSSRPVREAETLARDAKLTTLELQPLGDVDVARYLDTAGGRSGADGLSPDARRLLHVPFLLWAYVRSEAMHPGRAERWNRGELYRVLIDESLFGRIDAGAYTYESVKKPILAWLAARMTAAGETRVTRSDELLREILEQLDELAADRRIKPSGEGEFMPDPPNAADLVEELERTGELRVVGSTLEFAPHPSVQDYFTAVSLSDQPRETAVAHVPELDWRTVARYDAAARSFVMSYRTAPFVDALTLLCGIVADAGEIVRRLTPIDVIAAGACLADAASVDDADRSVLGDACRRLLAAFHPHKRWIGATAVHAARLDDEDIVTGLEQLARDEPEWQVREAAYAALSAIAPRAGLVDERARGFVDDLLARMGQVQLSSGELGPTVEEALDGMLGDRGSWPWEALLDAADTNASIHARTAAGLALRLRVADEHARLVDDLETGDAAAQVLAARVLGAGRSVAAIPSLLAAASAADARVRLAALQALVLVRADEVVAKLMERVGVFVEAESEPELRTGIAALALLVASGLEFSEAALDALVKLAKRSPFPAIRSHAFDALLGIPGGRSRLMDPIHQLLQDGDHQAVIDEIGAEEPFVPSPNLLFWRAMAFEGVGDRGRAIADAQRFIATAPQPTPEHFAFLASLFSASGQARRLADTRALAERRLGTAGAAKLEQLLESAPEPRVAAGASEVDRLDVVLAYQASDAPVALGLTEGLGEAGFRMHPVKEELAGDVVLLLGAGQPDETVLGLAAERGARDPFLRVVGVLLPESPLEPYGAAESLPITNLVDMRVGHDDPIAFQNLVAVLRGRREPFDVGPISEQLDLAARHLRDAVSAFELARHLLGSRFDLDGEPGDALRPRPVATWLLEIRRLYDRSLVEQITEHHALVGLATLDARLRAGLEQRSLLDASRAALGDLEPLLTAFARGVLSSQAR